MNLDRFQPPSAREEIPFWLEWTDEDKEADETEETEPMTKNGGQRMKTALEWCRELDMDEDHAKMFEAIQADARRTGRIEGLREAATRTSGLMVAVRTSHDREVNNALDLASKSLTKAAGELEKQS